MRLSRLAVTLAILSCLAPLPLAARPSRDKGASWSDEFTSGPGDAWVPTISPYPNMISQRTLPSGEQEVYTNRAFVGPDSVRVSGGVAHFTARPLTPDTRAAIDTRIGEEKRVRPIAPPLEKALRRATWTSGALSTKRTFLHGLYEASIGFDPDKSAWPAFWLYSRKTGFELDILESPGDGLVHCSAHWNNFKGKATVNTLVPEPGRQHRYGVLWEAGRATCLLDGKPFGTLAFPTEVEGPANLILCLAVGGWAKPTDNATPAALGMRVDWVRVRP